MSTKLAAILFASLLSALVPAASAIAQDGYGPQGWGHEESRWQEPQSTVPGTIIYVEGDVTLNGKPLTMRSGNTTAIKPGEFLQTGKGRAQVALTPGAFLLLDRNSALGMTSPDPAHLEVELDRGHARVEVNHISPQNYILIDQKSGGTQLLKRGLYEFDANKNIMRVYDGEAAVFAGDGNHPGKDKGVVVKSGRELTVADQLGKPKEFDRTPMEEDDSVNAWGGGWAWSPGLGGYTAWSGEEYGGYPYGFGFYPSYIFYGGGYYFGRGYGYSRGYGFGGGRR